MTSAASSGDTPASDRAVGSRPLFSVGDTLYRWNDVIVAAQVWGEWSTVLSDASEELACLVHAEATGDELAPGEFTERSTQWRRARRLLSVEELEHWLWAREVTVSDWRRHITGEALRERWRGRLVDVIAAYPAPGPGVLRTAAWTRGVSTSRLTELADRLATDAASEAAVLGLGRAGSGSGSAVSEPADVSPARLRHMDACREELVGLRTSEQALVRELSTRRTDWTRITCTVLEHGDFDVVGEAALCVGRDGLTLEQAADLASVPLRRISALVTELPPVVGLRLLGAEPGETLEPLLVDEFSWLVRIDAKTFPSLSDVALRGYAQSVVAGRALQQVVDEHVRWHERL